MSQTFFQHEIAYITARINIEVPNERPSTGTGFFYLAPLNDGTNRVITLFISNKHVFRNPKGKLTISLNRRSEDDTPEFGNVRTFNCDLSKAEHLYFDHPNLDVDLACLNVSSITHTDAFVQCIDGKFFKPIDYEKVLLGSDVIFVGYPEGLYDPVNNLPLIRKGSIASIPNVDFNGKGQIIIDAQIFPGSSGSPVFVAWDGKYSLLGVVSRTMLRDSKLQILQVNTPQLGVKEILGLGIVVKQKHVQELIDYAVNESIRKMSLNS